MPMARQEAAPFVGRVSRAAVDARSRWARPPNCDESRLHHRYQAVAETQRWRERQQLVVWSQAYGAGVTQPSWNAHVELSSWSEQWQPARRSCRQPLLQP